MEPARGMNPTEVHRDQQHERIARVNNFSQPPIRTVFEVLGTLGLILPESPGIAASQKPLAAVGPALISAWPRWMSAVSLRPVGRGRR